MEGVRAIVTYANTWDMTDEKTGQRRQGISLEYLMSDTMNRIENDDGSKGYKHCKESVPVECSKNIKEVPAMYELIYRMAVQKGKPVLKLDDLKFIESV